MPVILAALDAPKCKVRIDNEVPTISLAVESHDALYVVSAAIAIA